MSESDTFQYRSEKEIFFEALDKKTPEERAAFLDGACGKNPALRGRVEALLADHFQQDAFMKMPVVETVRPTIRVIPIAEVAGTVIGRYKLLQQIGEGGCGVVYMAEQEEPVRRRVALKVIKLGMDTKGVIARFEAERQALAMMDHPNIAKVLDAGATETGRPYFVMELVRGVKITDYCDQNNLSTRERLDLFIPVCHAIQHAHQKGIIHRDIKPSNVLVTMNDGVAMPKVIDFGIAKATTGKLTDQTLFTAFEQFIGTPAYMSPEQAEMSALDIDTRSDIYSLGVLLYELLTSRTPFNAKELLQAGLDEIRRTIREQEPARPSTCLSTMQGADLSAIAKHRKVEPPGLLNMVRGDLDWIVMKALEKDRTRRYETANGLAADVRRHLENEPVIARPPSTGYRLQKAFRRNKLAFAAAGAVASALVLGLGFSTWSFLREHKAHASEIAARRIADEQRQRAEAREAEAHRLLYVANMNLAQHAWEQNNIGQLRDLLAETRSYSDRGFEWFYWQRQTHQALFTFNGGGSSISSAAFSPDGGRIVAGVWNSAKVWDASTGKELLTFKGDNSMIDCVLFSPDGRRIITAGDDKTAKVWDAATGEKLLTLLAFTNTPGNKVAFSPDGFRIVTAGSDSTVKVWDAASGRELFAFNGGRFGMNAVAFSPDGNRIVTGGDDAKVRDAATGNPLLTLNTATTCLAFSPDGQRLVTGGGDYTAKVWDASNGQQLAVLKGHGDLIVSVAFSPGGKGIVTGAIDKTARVWDAASGRELATLKGHTGAISSVGFSPDGRRIVTASYDGTVKLWETPSNNSLSTLEAGRYLPLVPYMTFPVAFSQDGRRIVTVSAPSDYATRLWSGDTAQIWDAASGQELTTIKEENGRITSVALSPDGGRIATAGQNTANIWDATDGRKLVTLGDHGGAILSVAFSKDAQRVITLYLGGTADVWDGSSGRKLFTLKGHSSLNVSGRFTPRISSVTFSPDGQRIVTECHDKTAKVWDAATGQELLTLEGHTLPLTSVAFSPDGQRILTASRDQTAKVWDAATGRELLTLGGYTHSVMSVAFSPDGRLIVTGSLNETATVWDAVSGRELFTLKGHNAGVSAVAFSPDGRRILTGSGDKTAKLWDVVTGRELLSLNGHSADVSYVAFCPNGRWIVTGRTGYAEKIWEAARLDQVALWHAEDTAAVKP